MKHTIAMTTFNRPEVLANTLAKMHKAWRPGWTLLVSQDGHAIPDGTALPVQTKRRFNHAPLGCPLNSFVAVQTAFADGADAVLFMDDDIELAPDALDLCDWYAKVPRQPHDAGLALCRRFENDPTQPTQISRHDTHMGHLGQGWFFTRAMWLNFGLRYWWWWEPGMAPHDTYDWALCYMMQKLGKVVLRPRLARARHAGAVGHHGPGIGCFPDVIASGTGHHYTLA